MPIHTLALDFKQQNNAQLIEGLFAKIAQLQHAQQNSGVEIPLRVGIVYSANNEQAKAFQEGYYTGRPPQLSGKGQALLFKDIIARLCQHDDYQKVVLAPTFEKNPPLQGKTRGFYVYRQSKPNEIRVLVIHSDASCERHAEIVELSNLATTKEAKKLLKKIRWPENENDKGDFPNALTALIINYCSQTQHDYVHILPVATSMHGSNNTGKNAVSHAILQRDLFNIDQHLQNHWHVVVLTSPYGKEVDEKTRLLYHDNPKYLIGGGGSKEFYSNEHTVTLHNQHYSQGHYVEKILDYFAAWYNEADFSALEIIQAQLELPLFTEETTAFYLTHFIRRALVEKDRVSNTQANTVVSAKLSKSYNMYIKCRELPKQDLSQKDMTTPADKIAQVLNPYGAMALNVARKEDVKEGSIRAIQHHNHIISIKNDTVYAFLRDYCRIPSSAIKSLYEHELQRRRADHKAILIESDKIRVGKKTYTVENFIKAGFADAKQGKTALLQAAKDKIRHEKLHPERIRFALDALMSDLSHQKNHQPSHFLIPTQYRYRPIIQNPSELSMEAVSDCYYINERIDTLVMHYKREEIYHADDVKEKTSDDVKQKHLLLNRRPLVTALFNVLSQATWLKYKPLYACYIELGVAQFFSDKRKPEAVTALNTWGEKIYHFTMTEIHSAKDPTKALFKYQLYLEVALLSYVKGNFFLFVNMLGGLSDLYRCIKVHMTTREQWLFEYLDEKRKDLTKMRQTQQRYFANAGIVLPFLAPYNKLVITESSRGIDVNGNLTVTLDKELRPMLHDIAMVEIPTSSHDNQILSQVENATAPSKLMSKTRDFIQTDQGNVLLTALEHGSLLSQILHTFKQGAAHVGVNLNPKKTDNELTQSILKRFSDLIPVDRSQDGQDDTLVAFALRAQAWELANDLLFFNLSTLNTPNEGSLYLDRLIHHPERSNVFQSKAEALLQRYSCIMNRYASDNSQSNTKIMQQYQAMLKSLLPDPGSSSSSAQISAYSNRDEAALASIAPAEASSGGGPHPFNPEPLTPTRREEGESASCLIAHSRSFDEGDKSAMKP